MTFCLWNVTGVSRTQMVQSEKFVYHFLHEIDSNYRSVWAKVLDRHKFTNILRILFVTVSAGQSLNVRLFALYVI